MAIGALDKVDPETVDILTRGLNSSRHKTRQIEPDLELKKFAENALDALHQSLERRPSTGSGASGSDP
jgi:hypothetical protein